MIFYGVDSLSNDFRKRFLSSVFIIFLLFNYKSITFFFDNYFQRFEQVKYTLAKEYIYLLEKSDYKKDDYVFLDYGSYNCFDLYDKKNIINKEKLIVPVGEINYNINILDKIPTDENIFFYNSTKYHFWYIADLNEWINKKCSIIYSIEDYYGTFVKCRKN